MAHSPQELDPRFGQDGDTDPGSPAARIPGVRRFLRLTRDLGRSRTVFMPIGCMGLCALALWMNFPALEELVEVVLLGLNRGWRLLAGLGGGEPDLLFPLAARRALSPWIATFWSLGICVRLGLGTIPREDQEDELGYVVPGSGMLARMWGVIGKGLFQLKLALRYLRDLNVAKVHLPVTLVVVALLGSVALAQALGNLLGEGPARLAFLAGRTAWIPWVAGLGAAVAGLVLGWPMLVIGLQNAHRRSVAQRQRKRLGMVRRRLTGLLGLFLWFLPVVWLGLTWLSGA